MKVIRFFMRCSKSISYSKRVIAFVIVAGVVGGVANTAVLALINRALNGGEGGAGVSLVWLFAALCLVTAASKALSQIMLIRFATGTVFRLRMELCGQI